MASSEQGMAQAFRVTFEDCLIQGQIFYSDRALDNYVGIRHYSVIRASNTADHFIAFLEGLAQKLDGTPTTLVLDNLSIHHSRKVRDWLEKHSDIKIIYLPLYSCAQTQSSQC